MTRIWDDTRPLYYGNTAERNAFDQVGEASGALFWDYDDGMFYYWDGAAWVVVGAPANAQYLTLALDATLTAERVFVDGVALTGVDGGAGGNYTLGLDIKSLAALGAAPAGADAFVVYDDTAGAHREVSFTNILAGIDEWELGNTITVGPTGDHATIAAALAAAGAGDLVLVDVGTYNENVTIGADITLAGIDRDTVIIQIANATYTVVMSGAAARLRDITVKNTYTVGTPACVHTVTGGNCILYNVKGEQNGAAAAGRGIYCQATTSLIDCEFDSQATSAKSLYGTAVVHVYGGIYHEDVEDAAGIYLYGMPECQDVATVTAYGHWQDDNGKQRAMSPIDFDGLATAIIFDADGDSDLSSPADDVVELSLGTTKYRFQADALVSTASAVRPNLGSATAGDKLGDAYFTGFAAGDSHPFVVKNTSGVVTSAGDLGYIDEAGEYKETTTAYSDVAWCVVVVGGANNADIYVARRGRVTIVLNGNCSVGDYLYTSTTAGQAQPQSYVRPEVMGVALTANAGGAGGTCEALLLCETKTQPDSSSNDLYQGNSVADSDFVATIATLPGGAVLTYNAPGSGNEANLVPAVAATQLAKMVLWNTTDAPATDALISDCNIGTNTITLTAAVPGTWAVGETITIRSQTNIDLIANSYFVDFEITDEVPALARFITFYSYFYDTGVAGQRMFFHPYEAGAASKRNLTRTIVAAIAVDNNIPVLALIENRFCVAWESAATSSVLELKWFGTGVAVP